MIFFLPLTCLKCNHAGCWNDFSYFEMMLANSTIEASPRMELLLKLSAQFLLITQVVEGTGTIASKTWETLRASCELLKQLFCLLQSCKCHLLLKTKTFLFQHVQYMKVIIRVPLRCLLMLHVSKVKNKQQFAGRVKKAALSGSYRPFQYESPSFEDKQQQRFILLLYYFLLFAPLPQSKADVQ